MLIELVLYLLGAIFYYQSLNVEDEMFGYNKERFVNIAMASVWPVIVVFHLVRDREKHL